jgi:hypothetical protein
VPAGPWFDEAAIGEEAGCIECVGQFGGAICAATTRLRRFAGTFKALFSLTKPAGIVVLL